MEYKVVVNKQSHTVKVVHKGTGHTGHRCEDIIAGAESQAGISHWASYKAGTIVQCSCGSYFKKCEDRSSLIQDLSRIFRFTFQCYGDHRHFWEKVSFEKGYEASGGREV